MSRSLPSASSSGPSSHALIIVHSFRTYARAEPLSRTQTSSSCYFAKNITTPPKKIAEKSTSSSPNKETAPSVPSNSPSSANTPASKTPNSTAAKRCRLKALGRFLPPIDAECRGAECQGHQNTFVMIYSTLEGKNPSRCQL